MKTRLLIFIIYSLSSHLAYCQSNENIKIELNQLKSENAILKAKVEALEANLKLLQYEVENLKSKTNTQEPSGRTNEVKDSKIEKNQFQAKPENSNYSGQCKATTKKGTKCSRTAKSNGYCWQHGGN